VLQPHAFKVPFVFNSGIVLLSFAFAAAGRVFGYFPAQRAARLDPIEALRLVDRRWSLGSTAAPVAGHAEMTSCQVLRVPAQRRELVAPPQADHAAEVSPARP
jgi:hypothetical protein